eukprot:EC692748.1.p4 GENE.EC692748.1~~EC692748.1.p4  ORF type:complete len:72 (+),score=8.63 EC692748.1:71-286(+)
MACFFLGPLSLSLPVGCFHGAMSACGLVSGHPTGGNMSCGMVGGLFLLGHIVSCEAASTLLSQHHMQAMLQ